MRKKGQLRCVLTGLSVALLIVFGTKVSGPILQSEAVTSISQYQENIKKFEKQKAQAEKEQKQLQQNVTNTKSILAELESDKADLAAYIQELDMAYTNIVENIEELENLITNKKADIEDMTTKLVDAQNVEAEQYEAMKVRMQFFYERSETYFIELLLTSSSFGELLNRIEYMQQVVDYDHNMLEEYRANVSYITACRETLEAEKKVLIEAEASLENERAALEDLIQAKNNEITKYEKDITDKEAMMAAYLQEIEDQKNEIAILEAAIQESQNELNKLRKFGSYDGSTFTWPCPKYTYISSEFGYRLHPIYKYRKFHSGLDMAAPYGSDIKAAYNGQVIKSAYDSSMGYYVMIDHGSNLYTVYMHCSKLLVKAGDLVYAGDVIAKVGSTGTSTGNHLHFSVRRNGEYVNPWDYLPSKYKK